jgi:pimeloyl-ACP methyl ester carboxylesterase
MQRAAHVSSSYKVLIRRSRCRIFAIAVPTLVLHGADDQVVPIDDSGRLLVELLKNGTLKVYPDPHGMLTI